MHEAARTPLFRLTSHLKISREHGISPRLVVANLSDDFIFSVQNRQACVQVGNQQKFPMHIDQSLRIEGHSMRRIAVFVSDRETFPIPVVMAFVCKFAGTDDRVF